MYERILVAVDHSEISARALEAARGLASLSHGEVWVLHLREREMMGKTGLLISTESSGEAGADVTAAVEALTRAGIKAHGVVRDIPCSATRPVRSSATLPNTAQT